MADVVRLSIVYDTQAAAARVTELNTRLDRLADSATRTQVVFKNAGDRWATTAEIMASMSSAAAKAGETIKSPTARVFSLTQAMGNMNAVSQVSSTRLQRVAFAGLRLSAGLASGNISATSLARSLGVLAGASVAGAVIVSIVNIINAFQEFKRISRDIENTIDSMQSAARDASADVQRILGEVPAGESPAERAIKRLRDAAAQLRKEAERLGGPAGTLLEGQAAGLEAQIPGIGARASKGAAATERRRLTTATNDYNKSLRDSNAILDMLNAGPLEQMNATMGLMEKRLRFLVENGKAAGDEAQQLALLLGIGAEKMRDMERSLSLLRNGLFTIADTIEEFVVTGTLAFTDFLNNILRLLYRDFSGELISGILQHAAGTVGTGNVSVGGAKEMGGVPKSGIAPSIRAGDVNFNITTMDARGVSEWVQSNGAVIAAEVNRQAGRSANLRRTMRRG